MLDGEIVAFDDDGRPDFELLQQRMHLTRESDIKRAEAEVPVFLYVFDLLHLGGWDLTASPLFSRKELLERTMAPTERVRYLGHFDREGEVVFRTVLEMGFEGMVAKRRDSVYEPAKRSGSWLKIKGTQSEDFIVGGYTKGKRSRGSTFGALLLGSYDDNGELSFVGHVGSGFDDRALMELNEMVAGLVSPRRPFKSAPEVNSPAVWLRPELVVEVRFTGWTDGGRLRAPVFLRLREDKPAGDLVRLEDLRQPDRAAVPTQSAAASTVDSVLRQLDASGAKSVLDVDSQKLPVSSLDKVLWPASDFGPAVTKRDYLRYLAVMSPHILWYIQDRPIKLVRFPEGISRLNFYQKHWDGKLPEFVETVMVYSEHNRDDGEYLLVNNLPTLLWLGQVADLELHAWYSRTSREPDGRHLTTQFAESESNIESSTLNYPDFILFDLDPYIYSGKEAQGAEPELNRHGFEATCEVALWVKAILESMGAPAFVKTSGKTGLHVCVPITRRFGYPAIHEFARKIATHVVRTHPNKVTAKWVVERRGGKVFFDYNQNVRGKTFPAVYSPRAVPGAPVSMPLTWVEIGRAYPTDFTIRTAPDRVRKHGDLWAGLLEAKRDLREMLGIGTRRTARAGRS